jgi:hypothetical protein
VQLFGQRVTRTGQSNDRRQMVSRRTQIWAVIALAGGLLLALTSVDSFRLATSPGMVPGVVSGAISVVLGLAIAVSAMAVARRGDVGQVTLLGLFGAAAFGWQYFAVAPVETAVRGGRVGLVDIASAVSALAALAGSVGVCLSKDAYRSATWECAGNTEGRSWLWLNTGAAVTSVIALFLPYAAFKAKGEGPTYLVDAWHYFTGSIDTGTLVLMLTCATLAALSLARPGLPYRWPLACVGVATLAFVFTPSQFGESQPGLTRSWEVGFWLTQIGALVVAIAGVISWRQALSARLRGTA